MNVVVPPSLSGTPPVGQVGSTYSFTPTNAGGAITNCTATGLPAGLSIDPTTCAITGTPTTPGTYAVTITATNAGGSSTLPTSIVISAQSQVTPAPTLGEYGLMLLASLLAVFGGRAMRSRRGA